MVSDDESTSSLSESSESKESEQKKLESIKESKESDKAESSTESLKSSIISSKSSAHKLTIEKEASTPTPVVTKEPTLKSKPTVIIDNRMAS